MKITLAQNLRKLRRDRDLTQEELAGFLGISYHRNIYKAITGYWNENTTIR